jgi:DNA mismatch repair ATPase MutS
MSVQIYHHARVTQWDRSLNALQQVLRTHSLLARLDEADLALARHLAKAPYHCWAERGEHLRLAQVAHPLLAQAAPLTLELKGQGAFISGQNGIGKSTLLRTIGLNMITARAFGFCYAEQAALPLLPVYSSMQSEDSLGSESLYLAKLRRAQELLALAERGPALFIIDEIFRGTNYLESISAAAAVLHTLAARGTVIVSSHNLVLAPLLEDCLAPWCVSAPEGDRTRLTVAPGGLAATNGIALLSSRGFGPAIESKAARVFDWLSGHLSHPAQVPRVLAGT